MEGEVLYEASSKGPHIIKHLHISSNMSFGH